MSSRRLRKRTSLPASRPVTSSGLELLDEAVAHGRVPAASAGTMVARVVSGVDLTASASAPETVSVVVSLITQRRYAEVGFTGRRPNRMSWRGSSSEFGFRTP